LSNQILNTMNRTIEKPTSSMAAFRDLLRAWPHLPSQKNSRRFILLEAIALTLIIGYVDYLTIWEVTLSGLYAIPIWMMAWRGDLRRAVFVAILGAAIYYWVNVDSNPYKTTSGFVWASVNRLVYFLFVAVGGTALRNQREEVRTRLESNQQIAALEHEIVRVSEREQMRIGQDLHDGLCQNLAAINCAVACLKTDLETDAREEASAAGRIQSMLQDAVIEARNVARGISPVHTDAEDLAVVLEELVAGINPGEPMRARFTQIGEVGHLDPQISLHFYRIAQEAARNAIKHAEATEVAIVLQEEEHVVKMTVSDNGRGFTGTPSLSKGMGLGTMRYRARLIGAELDISSKIGKGTVITCILPPGPPEESAPDKRQVK